MTPSATISALYRYPIKGFSAEAIEGAHLLADAFFPNDRIYALEVGASGYDKTAPKFISKMRYAVLARFVAVSRFKTRFDEVSQTLHVGDHSFDLKLEDDRARFAVHVQSELAMFEDYDPELAPLRLLDIKDEAISDFRFTDSPKGFVSILNLNSVRDLSKKIGIEIDPIRLRANIWVDGWAAFKDHEWVGKLIKIGDHGPILEVLKPIVRCVATHVNPTTFARDIDLCAALFGHYGHRDCGIYCRVVSSGEARVGNVCNLIEA